MLYDIIERRITESHLTQYTDGQFGCQSAKVFFTRCNHQSCHIQGTRRHDKLAITLSCIAVWTVLLAGYDHEQIVVITSPAQNIHHRLRLVFTL